MATSLDNQPRCDLCGSKKNAEWKCRECSQIMCRRCKKLHVKTNISKFHHFISLKPFQQELKDSCNRHKTETYYAECRTCQQYVCKMCVQHSHVGHEVLKISHSIEEQKEKCCKIMGDFKDTTLSVALKEMETFRQLADEYKVKTQTLLKEVTSRHQSLVAMAKSFQDTMLRNIQSIYKLDMSYYETEGKIRENIILQMDDVVKNFQNKIDTSEGMQGLLELKELEMQLTNMMTSSNIVKRVVPSLSQSALTLEVLREYYGHLSFTNEENNYDDQSIQVSRGGSSIPENSSPPNSDLNEKDNSTSYSPKTSIGNKPTSLNNFSQNTETEKSCETRGEGMEPVITNLMRNETRNTRGMVPDTRTITESKSIVNSSQDNENKTKTGPEFSNSMDPRHCQNEDNDSVSSSSDYSCHISLEFASSSITNNDPRQKCSEHQNKLESQDNNKTLQQSTESIFCNSKVLKRNISIHDTFFTEDFNIAPKVDKICHVYLQGKAKICSVCPVGDKAWVGFSDKSVALVNGKGVVIKRSKVDIMPLHLAANFSGEVLICSENMTSIKSMSPTGQVQKFKKFPVETGGIYVTRNGYTLVSLPSLGKIVCLSQNGEVEYEMKNDKNGERFFEAPYAIAENIEGNICVIDGKGNWLNSIHKKYVICIDKQEVIFRFACDKMSEFHYIACDQYSNILLADPVNFHIKMLNRNGSYIGVLGIDSFLHVNPRSVTFDEHYNLWVVNDKNRITLAKYVLD